MDYLYLLAGLRPSAFNDLHSCDGHENFDTLCLRENPLVDETVHELNQVSTRVQQTSNIRIDRIMLWHTVKVWHEGHGRVVRVTNKEVTFGCLRIFMLNDTSLLSPNLLLSIC